MSDHHDDIALIFGRANDHEAAAILAAIARQMGDAIAAAGVDLDDEDDARLGRATRDTLAAAGYGPSLIDVAIHAATWAAATGAKAA